jgi:hypothetical protein
LAEIVLPLLSIAALVPKEKTPLSGKLTPATPILLLLMVLPSFPVVIPVLKNIIPLVVDVEPRREQYVMVLLLASLINRISTAVPVAVFDMAN